MTSPRPVALPPAYAPPQAGPPCDLLLDGRAGVRWPAARPVDAPALEAYPDARELEGALADRFAVAPERVIVTAGADDALDRACRAYLAPDRTAVLTDPTFAMLPHYAALRGAAVRSVAWPDGPLPLARLLEAARGAALVAVVTPCNPTGLVAPPDELIALATARPDALVVVDLAYVEFADEDPTAALLALPNVLVVRTFSKAFGLASARVGYALGPAPVIAALRAAGGPYPTAAASLATALERLQQGDGQLAAIVHRTRRERRALACLLRRCGLEASDSQANFLHARDPRAPWLADALAGMGVAVRRFGDGTVRLGLPANAADFARLWRGCAAALAPEALLLDLDGVLADVSASYRTAIRRTAARFGVGVDEATIAAAKAQPDSNNDWRVTHRLVAAAGATATLEEVTATFEEIMDADELWRRERLITEPGLLARLAGRLPLAVVTGRPRRDAERFLDEHGLAPLVRVLVTLEDAPPKPDPAPLRLALERLRVRRAWMVGDMPDDLTAARAAGVIPLGVVAPGDDPAATTARLTRAGAARVLASLADLEDMLP
jgi:HAD superfamily hydrolase (TIGR01548 family)